MKISVVIPTFNRMTRVVRAIQSVLVQSYAPHEVIVVDDGSTDDTVANIKREFPQVKLISRSRPGQPQGVSRARNIGIQLATGDWIALLDSDDEWCEHKLTTQVAALTRSSPPSPQLPSQSGYQICHTDETWIRHGKRVNPMKKHAKPNGWIFEQCLVLCCVSPSSVLIKKTLLERVGLFDESLPACEDYDLWLRIFSQLPVLLVAEKLLIKYGGHADQLSQKYWGMDRFRVSAIIKLLEQNKLEQNKLSEYNRQCAVNILLQKLAILIKGFEKRKNTTDLMHYQALYERWSDVPC